MAVPQVSLADLRPRWPTLHIRLHLHIHSRPCRRRCRREVHPPYRSGHHTGQVFPSQASPPAHCLDRSLPVQVQVPPSRLVHRLTARLRQAHPRSWAHHTRVRHLDRGYTSLPPVRGPVCLARDDTTATTHPQTHGTAMSDPVRGSRPTGAGEVGVEVVGGVAAVVPVVSVPPSLWDGLWTLGGVDIVAASPAVRAKRIEGVGTDRRHLGGGVRTSSSLALLFSFFYIFFPLPSRTALMVNYQSSSLLSLFSLFPRPDILADRTCFSCVLVSIKSPSTWSVKCLSTITLFGAKKKPPRLEIIRGIYTCIVLCVDIRRSMKAKH